MTLHLGRCVSGLEEGVVLELETRRTLAGEHLAGEPDDAVDDDAWGASRRRLWSMATWMGPSASSVQSGSRTVGPHRAAGSAGHALL